MTLVLPAGFGPAVDATAAVAVAQQPSVPAGPEDPGGQGEDFGKSSPVGLVLIVLLFLAAVLLVRSMTRHLKRLPESFDPPEQRPDDLGPKYQLIWARNIGVSWNVKDTYNARQGLDLETLEGWTKRNLTTGEQ